MTDITLPIVAVITIVLAAMGAFAFLVRVIAKNFEKAIDTRFAAMVEAHKSEQETLGGRIGQLSHSVERLTADVHRMQVELPREYTRRDDHVQAMATVNAKIDAVQAGQQQLIMMVGTLNGRNND